MARNVIPLLMALCLTATASAEPNPAFAAAGAGGAVASAGGIGASAGGLFGGVPNFGSGISLRTRGGSGFSTFSSGSGFGGSGIAVSSGPGGVFFSQGPGTRFVASGISSAPGRRDSGFVVHSVDEGSSGILVRSSSDNPYPYQNPKITYYTSRRPSDGFKNCFRWCQSNYNRNFYCCLRGFRW